MFCFLNSDQVTFSREFAFNLFINYAYMAATMYEQVYKTVFGRNSSLGLPYHVPGLKWENKHAV